MEKSWALIGSGAVLCRGLRGLETWASDFGASAKTCRRFCYPSSHHVCKATGGNDAFM